MLKYTKCAGHSTANKMSPGHQTAKTNRISPIMQSEETINSKSNKVWVKKLEHLFHIVFLQISVLELRLIEKVKKCFKDSFEALYGLSSNITGKKMKMLA